jgi:small GTP-binding protein
MVHLNEPFKIVMIGDTSVGKTTLLNTYYYDKYLDTHTSTVGVDFKSKIVKINNENIKCHFWDTAGQERFRSITKLYYRNAHCVFLMFDLTDELTFESLDYWFNDIIAENINTVITPVIILIGTKSDLGQNVISENKINNFIDKCNYNQKYIYKYFKSSSKSIPTVNNIFNYMYDLLYELYKNKIINMPEHLSNNNSEQYHLKCCNN